MKKILLTALLIPAILGSFILLPAIPQSSAAAVINGFLPTAETGIRFQNDLISLDVRDADLRDVLREIAQKAKIEIALGDGLRGRINISLTDVTIEEALKQLCQSNALVYEYLPDRKAYRIVSALALPGTKEQRGSQAAASASAVPAARQSSPEALAGKTNVQPPIPAAPRAAGLAAGDQEKPRYKPGELLVKFKPGATERQIGDLHRSLGSQVIGNINNLRLQRIKLREGLAEQEAMGLYRAAGIVEHVEKHVLRYPNLAANDPDVYQQWGLTMMKAQEAWDITRGNPEVVVAIIDTGVDYRHPDLKDNIWINRRELDGLPGVDDDGNGYIDDIRGWDFAGNDEADPVADADPLDVNGHGTHIAGIIAAGGNNGLGIAGLNWQAKIMPLKVQADNGTYFDDFAIIEAIQYALAQGARIINCSFGGGASSESEINAFTALKNAGVLVVAAAGNDGRNTDAAGPNYPSGYDLDNIIAVAASDRYDNRAGFSNYGLASVDVMAPGVEIYSTMPVETDALVITGGPVPVAYQASGMTYAGITAEGGITGTAHYCGLGKQPDDFPAAVSGNIALIERGELNFSEKVTNAQAAGAVGVIIYNKDDGNFSGTLGSSLGNWVPVVSIAKADGEALKAMETPVVTLINKLSADSYAFMSGTSMAAPQVAGLAGLILAQCPALEYAGIKAAILNTVDKIPAAAGQIASGGRINALAALAGTFLPGDLTGDCRIRLDDAILVLQILSGLSPQPPSCPNCRKDVNGDDKIGIEEAVYILQQAAGLR